MLKLNTIDPALYQVLNDLSKLPELSNFSLVGGTALALQLGHRKSDDLDFFTDRSFDLLVVKNAILNYNRQVQFINEGPLGLSFIMPLPGNEDDVRKLDIYNWAVKFIRPAIIEGSIRLASLEDIAAFKLDAIVRRKEKKDYVDIAMLLKKFSFSQMLDFYREKYPMNDQRLVLTQILDKEGLENSVNPEMLIELSPEQAFDQVQQSVQLYSNERLERKDSLEKERWKKIGDLLEKRRQEPRKGKGKSL